MASTTMVMWLLGVILDYLFIIRGIEFKEEPERYAPLGWTIMIILGLIGGTYVINTPVGWIVSAIILIVSVPEWIRSFQ